jgi:hypothetical protein
MTENINVAQESFLEVLSVGLFTALDKVWPNLKVIDRTAACGRWRVSFGGAEGCGADESWRRVSPWHISSALGEVAPPKGILP